MNQTNLTDWFLPLSFKGDRNYAHMTDIYLTCLSALENFYPLDQVSNLSLSCKKNTQHQLRLTNSMPPHELLAALLTFKNHSEEQMLYVEELEAKIEERRPYPEDEISAACKIDGTQQRISLQNAETLDYKPIELVVAMNKALHQACLSDAQGKWVAVHIDTESPLFPKIQGDVTVILENARSYRMTKSHILHNEKQIGEIRFSLMRKT